MTPLTSPGRSNSGESLIAPGASRGGPIKYTTHAHAHTYMHPHTHTLTPTHAYPPARTGLGVSGSGDGAETETETAQLNASPVPAAPMEPLQLTADHNCLNIREVEAVRARCTTDPNPIRVSRNDAASQARLHAAFQNRMDGAKKKRRTKRAKASGVLPRI